MKSLRDFISRSLPLAGTDFAFAKSGMRRTIFFFVVMLQAGVAAAQLRDVKAPIDYPSILGALVIIVIILACSGVGYYLFQRFRNSSQEKTAPILTPWQKAQQQLTLLKKEELLSKGYVDQYYSHLSDILRRYIEERFSIRAPEMTTEEFLRHLRSSSDLFPDQKEALKRFLESCDMVKFAKYAPDPSEAKQSFDLAAAFIQETTPAVSEE